MYSKYDWSSSDDELDMKDPDAYPIMLFSESFSCRKQLFSILDESRMIIAKEAQDKSSILNTLDYDSKLKPALLVLVIGDSTYAATNIIESLRESTAFPIVLVITDSNTLELDKTLSSVRHFVHEVCQLDNGNGKSVSRDIPMYGAQKLRERLITLCKRFHCARVAFDDIVYKRGVHLN